jgi:rhodanese-related sulfurtransferase
MKSTTTISAICVAISFSIAGQVSAEGNRYNGDRYYKSEISVSEAYLEMTTHGKNKPVLIDVRSLREYASGHPEDAYNVPYPYIYNAPIPGALNNEKPDPVTLYWEVYDIVKGKLDTPIMLLCRTGHRSVSAGNILANPDSDLATQGLAPFTNVRNIWEGFVGGYRYAFDKATGAPLIDPPVTGKPVKLDLNNDKTISLKDAADVYIETMDANPDKDGWRNFAGLPWTTQIKKSLSFLQDSGQYTALNLTPVQ